MCNQIDSNSSVYKEVKNELKQYIAYNNIYGSDIGRDPNLSRIARLNMYLHGDGGSSIFNTDSLDKQLPDMAHDLHDVIDEKNELRNIYKYKDGYFDVAITNPPFAKAYKSDAKSEGNEGSTINRILKQYELSTWPDGKKKNSLKSSLMFYERYFDILVPGGRLVSVIDDGLLSGSGSAWFRSYLRERFIVRAV